MSVQTATRRVTEDVAAALAASQLLANALGLDLDDVADHLFSGVCENMHGARSLGRCPYIEFAAHLASDTTVTTDSVQLRIELLVRARVVRRPTETPETVSQYLHDILHAVRRVIGGSMNVYDEADASFFPVTVSNSVAWADMTMTILQPADDTFYGESPSEEEWQSAHVAED